MSEETVVDAPVDGGPEAGATGDTETPIDQETRTVPLETLKAIETKLKTVTEQNKLYAAQLATPQQPAAQPAQPSSEKKDVFDGMPDDGLMTVADVKKAMAASNAETQGQLAQVGSAMGNMQFALSNPDYNEVIKNFQTKMNADPSLKAIAQSQLAALHPDQKLQGMYNFAKAVGGGEPEAKDQPVNIMSEIDKILANEEKPKSPAGVGGAGASAGGGKYDSLDITTPQGLADFNKAIDRVKGLH